MVCDRDAGGLAPGEKDRDPDAARPLLTLHPHAVATLL